MNRRRTKPQPTGFWGPKVDGLIRACGWTGREAAEKFGCTVQTLRRHRYGRNRGMIRMKFLRRLRALETVHAPELDALAQGLIVTRGRMRYCWVDFPRPTRPADLQGLG